MDDSDNSFDRIPSHKYLPLSVGKTFWDEGQYEAIVKRLENGKRGLNNFLHMIEERAAIERRYADKLQSWYSKWSLTVKRGPEYGDVQTVWQSILNEGRYIADIHFRMSSKLGLSETEGIQRKVHEFKSSNYHKLPLQKELKEVKECKETFKIIQAPYKKAVENIMKYKKKYLETSKNCMHMAKKSKLDSVCDAKEKAKSKYIEAINLFTDNISETYTQEMKDEFQRCQDLELERLKFLLNSLHDYIGIVDQQNHSNAPLSSIYAEAMVPLNTVKPENIISNFAKKFGSSMPQNFPKFEDADMEPLKSQLQSITTSPQRPTIFDFKGTNALLARLKYLKSDGQIRSHARSSAKDFLLRRPSNTESFGSSARNSEFADIHQVVAKHSFDSAMLKAPKLSEDTSADDLTSRTSPNEHYPLSNVYVRAISNFHSTHNDHLSIAKGEVIYQMRGDENGWCYGRVAYKEGIYPSKAVRLLTLNIFSL